MKTDHKIHKPIWRIQRGCNVEWSYDRKSGIGVVTQILSQETDMDGLKQPAIVEIQTKTGKITLPVQYVRILKGS